MKINIKTLDTQKYQIDAQLSSTILDVKQEIIKLFPTYKIEGIQVIHKGKVLEDIKTVDEIGIKENEFLTLLYTAPKEKKPQEKPEEKKSEPPLNQSSSTTTSTTNTTTTTSNPTTTTNTTSPPRPPANPGISSELEKKVEQIMSLGLGYERPQVIECLRAAFGDCDRAMQYLQTGIPENLKRHAPAPAPPSGGGGGGGSGSGSSTGGGAPGVPPGIGTPLVTLFSNLVSSPQFDPIRQEIINNPTNAMNTINAVAQQLRAMSPQLSQLILAHPQEFLQALLGNVNQRRNQITLTHKEHDDVQNLIAFGFNKADALEAYLACDKNLDLAATYLQDRLEKGELLTDWVKQQEEAKLKEGAPSPTLPPPPPPTTTTTTTEKIVTNPTTTNTNPPPSNSGSDNKPPGPQPGEDKSGGTGSNPKPPGDDDDDDNIFS